MGDVSFFSRFRPHCRPALATIPRRPGAAGSFTIKEPFGHRLKLIGLCKGLRTTGWGGTMSTSAVQATRRPVQLLPRSLREHDPRLSCTDRDRLGERLRAMYAALCDEPLSPKLQDCVERLTRTTSS